MYILNIGLENNPAPLQRIVTDLSVNCDLQDSIVKTGEYNGKPERTYVALVSKCNRQLVEKLCKAYTQECIAVYRTDFQDGILIYNPDFDGDRFDFDPKFFLFLD